MMGAILYTLRLFYEEMMSFLMASCGHNLTKIIYSNNILILLII